MSSQRYERVSNNDHIDDPISPSSPHTAQQIPSSPPPSFRSRTSSTSSRRLLSDDPATSDAERTLNDAFDDGSDSDGEGNDGDDRQRLMRNNAIHAQPDLSTTPDGSRPEMQRMHTQLPTFTTAPRSNRLGPSFSRSNDGVFANLDAKPEIGEKIEEQPPSYEVAAADATPPYWETMILAPNSFNATDEVYVDGLPVGSVFSFVWNAMISMSFFLVGFLLTYLLHTTHAAKNGSRAGLGVTLVQYGFYMRSSGSKATPTPPSDGGDGTFAPPADPNSHDFDPNSIASNVPQASTGSSGGFSGVASSNALAYTLMIIGWFVLIRAVSDFFKARQHEQLVLRSPDRGLNVPVVADNERPEGAV